MVLHVVLRAAEAAEVEVARPHLKLQLLRRALLAIGGERPVKVTALQRPLAVQGEAGVHERRSAVVVDGIATIVGPHNLQGAQVERPIASLAHQHRLAVLTPIPGRELLDSPLDGRINRIDAGRVGSFKSQGESTKPGVQRVARVFVVQGQPHPPAILRPQMTADLQLLLELHPAVRLLLLLRVETPVGRNGQAVLQPQEKRLRQITHQNVEGAPTAIELSLAADAQQTEGLAVRGRTCRSGRGPDHTGHGRSRIGRGRGSNGSGRDRNGRRREPRREAKVKCQLAARNRRSLLLSPQEVVSFGGVPPIRWAEPQQACDYHN